MLAAIGKTVEKGSGREWRNGTVRRGMWEGDCGENRSVEEEEGAGG